MKLNKKGIELADKWYAIWEEEIDRQIEQYGNEAETGWSILENSTFEKTIDDCIGIALIGNDDDAIYHILEWYKPDEHYAFGYTAAQVVEMMKSYFDISDDDDLSWGE